jgi:hypothetical protein
MADPIKRYALRPPQSSADWGAYHAIRRDAIFTPLLPLQDYDGRIQARSSSASAGV